MMFHVACFSVKCCSFYTFSETVLGIMTVQVLTIMPTSNFIAKASIVEDSATLGMY